MPKVVNITRAENGFIFNFQDDDSPCVSGHEVRTMVYEADKDGVEGMLDEIQFRLDVPECVVDYIPVEVTRQMVTGYFTVDELQNLVNDLRENEASAAREREDLATNMGVIDAS